MNGEHNKKYHINIDSGDCGEFVLLTGDPGRVEQIARQLNNPIFISSNREYVIWNGTLKDKKVTVCSTGIGGPSTAIAVHELAECGARTFIRIGTCGAMQTGIVSGELIITTGAVRGDGTSVEYLPIEFPAVPDFNVTCALVNAAGKLCGSSEGERVHIGVIQSKDSFYSQHSPETKPIATHLTARWEAYIKGGCLASEMEAATLFITAASLGLRAGAVLTSVWNQERVKAGLENREYHDSSRAIAVAVAALEIL